MTPLEAILRAEEGYSLTPYKDSLGYWTVGIGHKLMVKGDSPVTQAITAEQAQELFDNDIKKTLTEIQDAFDWLDDISINRQAVLASMAYQMGIAGLKLFKGTLAALQAGNWQSASDNMLDSLWAEQTPDRASRHAEIIRTDVLPEYYTT